MRLSRRHTLTTITPLSGGAVLNFRELWTYRELFFILTMRDIKVRYKQTVLGAAWAVIQPLTTMVIFTIIFGRLAKIPSEGYPYPVFVYTGLLPWTFFANAVSTSSNALVNASTLISKIYFPRFIVPLSSLGVGLVDLMISMGILLLLMFFYDIAWTIRILIVPFLMMGVFVTVLGIGLFFSALIVTYRDFRFVIPFMVQIWMYVTPVVYGVGFIPAKWRWLLFLNPMTGYIDNFRAAFLGKPFNWDSLSIAVTLSLLLLGIGVAYFGKVERRFADVI